MMKKILRSIGFIAIGGLFWWAGVRVVANSDEAKNLEIAEVPFREEGEKDEGVELGEASPFTIDLGTVDEITLEFTEDSCVEIQGPALGEDDQELKRQALQADGETNDLEGDEISRSNGLVVVSPRELNVTSEPSIDHMNGESAQRQNQSQNQSQIVSLRIGEPKRIGVSTDTRLDILEAARIASHTQALAEWAKSLQDRGVFFVWFTDSDHGRSSDEPKDCTLINLSSVSADDAGLNINLMFENHDIRLRGNGLRLQRLAGTGSSGDLSVQDILAEQVVLVSTSGDLELAGTQADRVNLTTTSGDQTLSKVTTERLSVAATSGDITLKGVDSKGVSIAVTSGDVTWKQFEKSSQGQHDISSTSGDVEIEVQKGHRARVVHNSKVLRGEVSPKDGGPGQADAKDGALIISTTSGGVEIEEKND